MPRAVPTYQDDKSRPKILRQYVGTFLVVVLLSIATYICFKLVLAFILLMINIIDAVIENANRSMHTLVIQRFDDELHVETQIDPKLQISQVSLAPQQQRTCIPRETVKDFEKGTEVFSKDDNCFVRFFNQSQESYDQQMLLFQMLKGVPLQQAAEPAVFQAVQQLQFTDRLYDLLGRQVAARCNLRRLFWILPAPPLLARHLTACRCFDTLHARISVCLQTEGQPGETPRAWEFLGATEEAPQQGETTQPRDFPGTMEQDPQQETTQPWDYPEMTEQVPTKRPKRKPLVGKRRRGIDSIVMKPDDLQLG